MKVCFMCFICNEAKAVAPLGPEGIALAVCGTTLNTAAESGLPTIIGSLCESHRASFDLVARVTDRLGAARGAPPS